MRLTKLVTLNFYMTLNKFSVYEQNQVQKVETFKHLNIIMENVCAN